MTDRTAIDWGQPEPRAPAGRVIAGRALLAFGLPLVVVVAALIPVGSPLLVGAGVAVYAGGVLWWVKAQGARALRAAAAERPRSDEAARMVNLVAGLSADLGIASPEVLVSRRGGANALVCLASGPKLLLTRALLEEFTRTEQEAVAAHCLVRLRGGQVRSAQLALALGPFGASLAGPVGGFDDVAATALTRYPPALAAAIRKSDAATGRYSGLWFVGAGAPHVPGEQRAAALADL